LKQRKLSVIYRKVWLEIYGHFLEEKVSGRLYRSDEDNDREHALEHFDGNFLICKCGAGKPADKRRRR
jgi:hypothetical protein